MPSSEVIVVVFNWLMGWLVKRASVATNSDWHKALIPAAILVASAGYVLYTTMGQEVGTIDLLKQILAIAGASIGGHSVAKNYRQFARKKGKRKR